MNRRDVMRLLGTAAGLPFLGTLTADELLAAGEALHARSRALGARAFRALAPREAATVTAIAERIIPETDTPGATAAGVPEFIDLIVGEWYPADEAAAFRGGLIEVDARSQAAHGVDFVAGDEAQQTAVLEQLEAESERLRDSGAYPQPFFARMKYLTLWGYYTSETGAIRELAYETIPGQFNGCVPIPATHERGTRP